MLVKAAAGRQSDIDALTALLARPDVDGPVRRRIDEKIRAIRSGVKGIPGLEVIAIRHPDQPT